MHIMLGRRRKLAYADFPCDGVCVGITQEYLRSNIVHYVHTGPTCGSVDMIRTFGMRRMIMQQTCYGHEKEVEDTEALS